MSIKIRIDEGLAMRTLETGEKISRAELARRVLPDSKYGYFTIKRLTEGNYRKVDPELLIRIAKELDVSVEFLLGIC